MITNGDKKEYTADEIVELLEKREIEKEKK